MHALDRVTEITLALQVSSALTLVPPEHKLATERTKSEGMVTDELVSPHTLPSSDKNHREASLLLYMQLSASFTQATALFECNEEPKGKINLMQTVIGLRKSIIGSDTDLQARGLDVMKSLRSFRKAILKGKMPEDKEYERAEAKAKRALERLRRALIKYLNSSQSTTHKKIARNVLSELLLALEETIDEVRLLQPNNVSLLIAFLQKSTVESYTPLLDTLFMLARTTISTNDPLSIDECFAFLSRTVTILNLELSESHEYKTPITCPASLQPDTYASYVRCISGAFHNLACILYQADRYGYAIRFLRNSCVLGDLATRLARECGLHADAQEVDDEEPDAWEQLDEQMTRRWELLGVCYSKITDRRVRLTALHLNIKVQLCFFSLHMTHLLNALNHSHSLGR
jgi:hypothetical protein